MSYTQNIYHIVIRTKHSKPTISQENVTYLYKYIWGIIKNKKGVLFRINGMEDHIHIISDLHPSIALADYMKNIKVATSLWMKSSGYFPLFEGWSEGYYALSHSYREKNSLVDYVKNQQIHHQKINFEEEIARIFQDMEIDGHL